MDRKDLKPWERSLIDDLKDAWIGSETLSELVRGTDEFLSSLISADCMSVCISKPDGSAGYDWLPMRMPKAFFERSSEWERDDFLRQGVVLKPGTVLRDTDLISPESLTHNAMRRISREEGMPLSHAISVLLPFQGMAGHGGFTAYRSRPLPFTKREQWLVQHVARLLGLTLQKCRKLMAGDLHARLFGSVTQDGRVALMVLEPPDGIVTKTDLVSTVVSRWFAPSECTKSGIPKELLGKLASLVGREEVGTWERSRGEEFLKATFMSLPSLEGPVCWQLKLEEGCHSSFEIELQKLTPKETEVAHALLQGKSRKEIACLVKCEPETVKKHVDKIYRKTGIHSQAEFIARFLKKPPENP